MSDSERGQGLTDELAHFIVDWRPEHLPIAALNEAKRAMIDIVGVALVGSLEPSSAIAATFARQQGGTGPAVLIGHGNRTSASLAALANGTSAHALDFDPSATVATTGHPVVCVAPAALATAEEVDATGQALLEALVIGFEVVSRLGRLGGGDSGDFYLRGFHGTSVFGIFGATAAASRLLGLSIDETCQALSMAASGPKGVRANYGTMTKPLHAGEAARGGVTAAMLARRGFTASTEAMERHLGWIDAVLGGAVPASMDPLGVGPLAIEEGVNFKRFPSGGASHAAIRAVLGLRSKHGLEPSEIAGIEIAISAATMDETLVIEWPTSGLEGKFCLAFGVAAAWADGKITVGTFADDKVDELAAYRGKITVEKVPGHPPVVARISTVDGRLLSWEEPTGKSSVDDPTGGLLRLGDEQLREKFHDNVSMVRSGEQTDALLACLEGLEVAESLEELTGLLA